MPLKQLDMAKKEVTLMRQKGLTIIQTMLILLVVGIAGSFIVDYFIDKRCEASNNKELCETRK